jgi:uncharacterized membrane protein YjjB (DUF3815 family)
MLLPCLFPFYVPAFFLALFAFQFSYLFSFEYRDFYLVLLIGQSLGVLGWRIGQFQDIYQESGDKYAIPERDANRRFRCQ